MAAFSTVPGIGWNALTFWRDELQRAIRERQVAYWATGLAWDSSTPPISAGSLASKGTDIQSIASEASIARMQQDIESYVGNAVSGNNPYVDHTQGGGDFSGLTELPYYTVESFCDAAGLSYVPVEGEEGYIGWRASVILPSDPAFVAYETRAHARGDIIGSWCMQDIQKACAAMKWTMPPAAITDLGGGDYTVEPEIDWFGTGVTPPSLAYVFDVYEVIGGVLSLYATDATLPVAYTTETIAGVVVKWTFTHDALPA